MNRARISLSGSALQAADRIVTQTGIENYSELINLLLKRYEADFIAACNGFFNPSVGQNGTTGTERVKDIQNFDQLKPSVGQTDPQRPNVAHMHPKKAAKDMLMDFED